MLTRTAPSQEWLKNQQVDLLFLLLIPFSAVTAGYVSIFRPDLFPIIMAVNIWLLGYHHVISTYTRIAFSLQSVKEHRFLVFYLPVLVLAGTVLLTAGIGPWVIATTYLYWQWFHYTRQSYGISRFYLSKTGRMTRPWRDVNTYALYLLPLTGILYRSYQDPDMFLFLELETLPVPYEAVIGFLILSILAIIMQGVHWMKQYRQRTLSVPYALYIVTHHIIFAVGYLLIEDINFGWLVLNIWHNAQYIGFVWMYNNNKFKDGVDAKHPFLSAISQNGKFWIYIVTCLFVTFMFYFLLKTVEIASQEYTVLPMVVVIYMTVNFHHYIVDAVIWKRKRARQ